MVCRLYWYPMRAYHAYTGMPRSAPDFPSTAVSLLLLPALLVIDVYWFVYILKTAWKLLSRGQLADYHGVSCHSTADGAETFKKSR